MTRLVTILSATLLAACSTDAGGPPYITLGTNVREAPAGTGTGGSISTGALVATLCVRLPVLLGSRVVANAPARAFEVEMTATRDSIEVTFPGAMSSPSVHSYSLTQLETGVVDTVTLESSGETYEATIATGCTDP